MNTFGKYFRVSIFGESHGAAVGAVIDGVPAGLKLLAEDFMKDISRRKSGAKGTTPRIEEDIPEILSGITGGHTTGSPVALIFRNGNTRSSDYSGFTDIPRPGHADFTASVKWAGNNDPRGGGHFSGRLTLPLVAAGVIAKKFLASRGIPEENICARLVEIGGCRNEKEQEMLLDKTIKEGDSLGGIVECSVTGLPVGLGEPFFDSAESLLAHLVFAVPGVRGIEFGDGFASAAQKGSQHNDAITDTKGTTATNHSGGINGGITNGNPLIFRVAFKPTASIRKEQHTINMKTGNIEKFVVPGRHDVCFALRTPVIVEAAAAIVLADLYRSL